MLNLKEAFRGEVYASLAKYLRESANDMVIIDKEERENALRWFGEIENELKRKALKEVKKLVRLAEMDTRE